MEHIRTFIQHLNESKTSNLPAGVEEITYDDYYDKNGMLRSIQNVAFTKEEKQMLEMLREGGKLQKNANSKKEFEMAESIPRTHGYWAPPGATFGKKVNGTYYLRVYGQNPDLGLTLNKYYTSPSLDDLLQIAIDVIKPEFLGWIVIG